LMVNSFQISQGPFDVTVPGALGGNINVITREPQSGFQGQLLSKFGSYGFLSQGLILNGGNQTDQVLFGYNYSESDQYQDGKQYRLIDYNSAYSDKAKKLDAFEKDDIWLKYNRYLSDKGLLKISTTVGEARNVLLPRAGMDIERERTNLNKIEYIVDGAGTYSDQLLASIYYNRIEHYPYGKYRTGGVNNKRIEAISDITGMKLENTIFKGSSTMIAGLDFYHRNWQGDVFNRTTDQKLNDQLIPNVDEQNSGIYLKMENSLKRLSIATALRMDSSYTLANEGLVRSSAVTDVNLKNDSLVAGNVFVKYVVDQDLEIFSGAGISNRLPTGVERYIQESASFFGNPELKPARNHEFDLGFTRQFYNVIDLRIKGFYSYIKDHIYQVDNGVYKSWTNIDASIYGADVVSEYKMNEDYYLEIGAAYQRGIKLSYPENNNDIDLAEIAPLKTKIALSRELNNSFATLEWVHSDEYIHYDADAGERSINSWGIVNFRAGKEIGKNKGFFSFLEGAYLNIGVNNIFNKHYAVANSYEYDPTNPGGANVRIVNEPGTFAYGSLSYQF